MALRVNAVAMQAFWNSPSEMRLMSLSANEPSPSVRIASSITVSAPESSFLNIPDAENRLVRMNSLTENPLTLGICVGTITTGPPAENPPERG